MFNGPPHSFNDAIATARSEPRPRGSFVVWRRASAAFALVSKNFQLVPVFPLGLRLETEGGQKPLPIHIEKEIEYEDE